MAETPGWWAIATMAVDQLRNSLSDSVTGRLRPARVAAILVAVFLMMAVEVLTAELFANMWVTTDHRGFGHH